MSSCILTNHYVEPFNYMNKLVVILLARAPFLWAWLLSLAIATFCCDSCILISHLTQYFDDRWGGPLPQSWFDQQLILQKKILARMYELGMTPGICCLPSTPNSLWYILNCLKMAKSSRLTKLVQEPQFSCIAQIIPICLNDN